MDHMDYSYSKMTKQEQQYYDNKVIYQLEQTELGLNYKELLITRFIHFCKPEERADMGKCVLWYEQNINDREVRTNEIISTLIHDINGIYDQEKFFSPRSSSYHDYVTPQLN